MVDVAETQRSVLEQAGRAVRRAERIRGGVDDLELWLHDLVQAGLAEAVSRPWSSYEQMAERLVDAQAPGLARLVRDLGGLPHRAPGWPERMLIALGRLSLLLDAWRGLDAVDSDLRAEVRTLLGIPEGRADVLATPPVHDGWDVVGRRLILGERLSVQRTWLWGRRTQRWALLLDFAVGGQSFDGTQGFAPGGHLQASLCFYAGAARWRALLTEPPLVAGSVSSLPSLPIEAVLRDFAAWLGRNPWLERIPAAVRDVVPRQARGNTWCVIDADGVRLPLAGSAGWHLMALSGGHPIDLFGEWDGFSFWPLAVVVAGQLVSLRAPADA